MQFKLNEGFDAASYINLLEHPYAYAAYAYHTHAVLLILYVLILSVNCFVQ